MNDRKTLKTSSKIAQALRQAVLFATAVCLFTGVLRAFDDPSNNGGVIITNRAEAVYQDQDGANYQAVSPTVMTTIARVPSITVTPDDTNASETTASNERLTRLFRICNTGNSADFFLPLSGTVSSPATLNAVLFDTDNSGTVTSGDSPVQFGQSLTPQLAPGACYGVLFVIDTNAISPNTQLTANLSARSTLTIPGGSNFAQDTGTIINTVGSGVRFTSPANAALLPSKLVENSPRVTAVPGQALEYIIAFRNTGAVAAKQVRIIDELPAELEYATGTLRLNSRQLTDAADADEGTATVRHLELLIPEIKPDAVTEVRFQARLVGANNGSGIINTAHILASNAAQTNTSEAVAVINPVGTVYAGNSLGAVRIAGARVKLTTNENGDALALTKDIGFAPNAENLSSFTSDSNGGFSFTLNENQVGDAASPTRYILTVTAPNYRSRMVELLISRTAPASAAKNGFFTVKIRSLDGQPVAIAGGFNLTSDTVQINNLAALVFNIPMFDVSTLEITKSADKQTAEIGDIVSYRVQLRNASSSLMRNVVVRDTLPPSFVYADGTAQIENGRSAQAFTPTLKGSELTFPLNDLTPGANVTITYRVRIGANAPQGSQYNVAVAGGTQPDGTSFTTQPARAEVRVRGGVFSMSQIVIGRVFEDRNLNGQFDEGERPVSGARIFLNNGQSVVTDSAGMYNLPAVGEGSLVVSLDPLTVPQGYALTDDKDRRSSKSWTRLLKTPLGGGALMRQNFAIAPENGREAVSEAQKVIDVNAKTGQPTAATVGAADTAKKPVQIASADNKIPLGLPKNADNEKPVQTDRQAGTFTTETTELVEPVAAGSVLILSPKTEELIMSPALSINARVAKGWTVEVVVNGEKISASNIGETRVDNRNNVTTYSFVGLGVKPGENQISLTPVGANGERGKTEAIKVLGRGPVERLVIVPAKSQVQAGGREAVAIEIQGFDHWNNPAIDGQIGIETTAGRFLAQTEQTENPTQTPDAQRRVAVSLENGKAVVNLVPDGSAELAHLKAVAGKQEAAGEIRFTPELRPQIMVGLAEYSFGKNAPDIAVSGTDSNYRGRLAFYFRGQMFSSSNLLTLAYDSSRPLNRYTNRDRNGAFDPLDRAYPLFGDASQRFEDAQSNSKLFARLDRGSSYAMFGDMETDQQNLQLGGYARRLTGVKLHLENRRGDFVSLTGARPDTAFARDVFPGGGLSIVRLSHTDILQGSEVISLEIRDRRNPELVIKREQLIRSVDYNIDSLTGEIFFMRPISAFDYLLNLTQIVATYEYRGTGSANYVYTGRAVRNFQNLGLQVGGSYVNQRQGEVGAFQLGGLDGEKTLWNGGRLHFEAAMSNGRYASDVNVFDFYNDGATKTVSDSSRTRNGMALRVQLEQPLPFLHSRLRGDFSRSTANFYNPFGATVAPGGQHLQIDLEMQPTAKRLFKLGFTDERNRTRNVSNSRSTVSFLWGENWNDKLRTTIGFDHRHFDDHLTDKTTDSNLITAGVEYRPTERVEISVKREQNLGDADPTYPDQTTFAASYALNQNAKLFFTQRLASAAINPIGDFGGSGFASTGARNETAVGIESKLPFLGAITGRYQLENGVNGVDSFAVFGLQNRWNLNKQFALEGGFERGFLLKGDGQSFNSATFGGSWSPTDGFRASARYELRDRNGLGQLFSVGAAGRLGDNWTGLARAQWSTSRYNERENSASNITGAFAYRPVDSDKYALLFSYNHREISQSGAVVNEIRQAATRDRFDTLSTDGLYQLNRRTEIYGRFALRFNGNGNTTNTYTSALTYLGQARIQERLNNYFDVAAEGRWLMQPSSATYRRSVGAELGYWIMPDMRFGVGYNFTQTGFQPSPLFENNRQFRGGFYFTITTKLSNLFDLFGTSKQGLQSADSHDTTPAGKASGPQK